MLKSRKKLTCGRPCRRIWAGSAACRRLPWERTLAALGRVERNRYLVRARIEPYLITVFQDGRAIITGTVDTGVARSVYARYIGH